MNANFVLEIQRDSKTNAVFHYNLKNVYLDQTKYCNFEDKNGNREKSKISELILIGRKLK